MLLFMLNVLKMSFSFLHIIALIYSDCLCLQAVSIPGQGLLFSLLLNILYFLRCHILKSTWIK